MKTLGNEIFGENKPDSLMPAPSTSAAELAVMLIDLLFN